MSKTYDITELSDAALEVFLDVRAGEECVPVAHLSVADRVAVCAVLGCKIPASWLTDTYAAPAFGKARKVARDREADILDRQDEFYAE